MYHLSTLFFVATAMLAGCANTAAPSVPAQPVAVLRCEDLKGMKIPVAAIGLPSGGATITLAEQVPETAPYVDAYLSHIDGGHLLPTAPHCRVQGAIAPVDPLAPPIRFNVNLPLAWNGKSIHAGGGGLGGVMTTGPRNKMSGRMDPMPLDVPYPLNQGYVTFGSDNGHAFGDFVFYRNDEAMRNWGGDEIKKTYDVAQQIIREAYGRPAAYTLFIGESAGGREALMAAQRFGSDYAGVIATSPILSWTAQNLAGNSTRNMMVRGFLDSASLKLLAEKTRATCDAADGVQDGIVARYLECPNTAAQLRCSDGKAGIGCLSDDQVLAVNAQREPYALPFPLANGVQRFEGFGATGTEDEQRYGLQFYFAGITAPSLPLPPGTGFEPGRGAIPNIGPLWIRNAIMQDQRVEPYFMDLRPHAGRVQYLSSLFDATSTDLSSLAARGGKLIVLQPAGDNSGSTPMTVSWFRSVESAMGAERVARFARLYIAAGGHHTTGPAMTDMLSEIEGWIRTGRAPMDQLTGQEMDTVTGRASRTFPVCRYPQYARYTGSGDPRNAGSFRCTDRPDPFAFAPRR